MTLDQLIIAAIEAKAKSPLGGDTIVHLCEDDLEYTTAAQAVLDTEIEHNIVLNVDQLRY